MSADERRHCLAGIAPRIDALAALLRAMLPAVDQLFRAVGADYERLCQSLRQRRAELLEELAQPLAA